MCCVQDYTAADVFVEVKWFEVKCFHKEREHWGWEKLNHMSSIITLKVIAVIGAQVPVKVTYTEESTSRR